MLIFWPEPLTELLLLLIVLWEIVLFR